MASLASKGPGAAIPAMLLLLGGALLVSVTVGAVSIAPVRLAGILFGGAIPDAREAAVIWDIRVPRAALAVAVGAALGLAGAAQQGLFRNPLADPALVGVSAGAALGAVAVIVLGDPLAARLAPWLPPRAMVPVAAFVGGLLASGLALRLARSSGGEGGAMGGAVAALLLAGVAINAVAGAGTGLLVTLSDDRQLRDITFWSMGSLASGGWAGAALTGGCTVVAALLLLPMARPLDALLLGEREAEALGVDTVRLRRRVVAGVALAVGGAVASAGVIGFVGLVVPHVVRQVLAGPRHGLVLPCAGLLGAALLLLADAAARAAVAPAELPIGLVTALLGGPFFVLLLMRQGRRT